MCQHAYLSTEIIIIHVYSYLSTCLLSNPKARYEVETDTLQGNNNKRRKIREINYITNKGKGKGKVVPLQARSDPEGSRKLRFPDFITTAQDGGKVLNLTHRPPLPQEIHLVLISVRG